MKKLEKKIKKEKIPKYKIVIAMMISMMIAIIPWVSYFKIINIPVKILDYIPNNKGVLIDFFIYYKEVITIFLAIVIIALFIGERLFTDKVIEDVPLNTKENRILIYSGLVYILMVILSYVFSDYRDIATMGYPTDGEGIFTLISYIVIFFAGVNYFCYKKSIKILKQVLIVFMGIFIMFSVVEFLYKPIFEIDMFKNILIPENYSSIRDTISNREFKDMVSLSFYNPNYYGVMCIVLYPIAGSLFIGEKNKRSKLGYFILSISLVICTFTSKTTSVVYIMMLQTIILIILSIKNGKNNYKGILKYGIIFLIVMIVINALSEGKLQRVVSDSLLNKSVIEENKEKFTLVDLKMNKDTLEIIGENNSLIIKLEEDENRDNQLSFFNEKLEKVDSFITEEYIMFEDEQFKMIEIEKLEYGIIIDIGYMDNMKFYITEEGFKGVGQNGVEIDKVTRDKVFGKSMYHIATGRGYTWVNTLPILKETIFIGKGPGNFAMNFQQNDYVGLMNTHENTALIIDKPHNMYLQIAVNTGVISLLSVILIIIIAIKMSSKVYLKKEQYGQKEEFNLGMGIFIGTLGFLISGVTNDSIVTISPMFWMLFGANLSILYYLKK